MRFGDARYFATLGIPLVRGGTSDPTRAGRLARRVSQLRPGNTCRASTPSARHVHIADGDRTIVGVVGDVRMRGP
jgi:hypothetical protein